MFKQLKNLFHLNKKETASTETTTTPAEPVATVPTNDSTVSKVDKAIANRAEATKEFLKTAVIEPDMSDEELAQIAIEQGWEVYDYQNQLKFWIQKGKDAAVIEYSKISMSTRFALRSISKPASEHKLFN